MPYRCSHQRQSYSRPSAHGGHSTGLATKTAVQRTALQWQDPVCATSGCTNRLGLEYDHVEDWAHTHTTRTEAGQRLCHSCHRRKTLGQPPPPSPGGVDPPAGLADQLAAAVDAAKAHARSLFDPG